MCMEFCVASCECSNRGAQEPGAQEPGALRAQEPKSLGALSPGALSPQSPGALSPGVWSPGASSPGALRAKGPQNFRGLEPFYLEVASPIGKRSWISVLKVGALPTKSNFAFRSFGVSSSPDKIFWFIRQWLIGETPTLRVRPIFRLIPIQNSTLTNNFCGEYSVRISQR